MYWGYVDLLHQELYALRTDYFMIIFGVTTGLLAMIGFVSFYIVNNSKQKLDQLMELIWTLKQIKHKTFETDQSNLILDKLYFYKKWMENKDRFNFKFLSLLKLTLYFVLITWLATLFLLDSLIEFVGIGFFYTISAGIMIIFLRKVGGLQKALKNSSFPEVEDILNGAQQTDIDGVNIAAMLSKLYAQESINHKDVLTVYFGLPCFDRDTDSELHFKNLELYMPILHFYTLSSVIGSFSGSTSHFLLDRKNGFSESTLALHSGTDWYEMKFNDLIRIPKACTAIEMSIFLAPKKENTQSNTPPAVKKGYWLTFHVELKDFPHQRGVMLSPTSVEEGILTDSELERFKEIEKNENKEKHTITYHDTLKKVSH